MILSSLKPPLSFPSLSGSIVTFNSQYAGLPLKSCTSLITGYQEGSGTPSSSNVRPIHAFSNGTLTANSDTYIFTFGQSIYQGYIDWLKGVVVATHLLKTINDLTGFDALSTPSNHVYRAYANGLDGLEYTSESVPTNAICSHFDAKAYAPISASDNGKFAISRKSVDRIVFIAQDYSTVSDFLTAFGNAQIAYPLAASIEIPLGGINLTTLQGMNTISADTGNTTLQYIKLG